MNNRLLILSVLLCGCMIGSHGDRCSYDQDGCSTGVRLPYHKTFGPACSKHDVCYACGKVHGFSRSDCDNRFYYGMVRICKSHVFWCRLWKNIYYAGVKMMGWWYYHGNDTKYECHSARVNDCLKK